MNNELRDKLSKFTVSDTHNLTYLRDKFELLQKKELLINSIICDFNEKRQLDRLVYVGLGLSQFIDSFTDLDFTIYFGCRLSVFKYGDTYNKCLKRALNLESVWNEVNYFNNKVARVGGKRYRLWK